MRQSPQAAYRLGEVLQTQNLLDEVQLQAAIAEQKQSHKRLGEILLERGFITERQLRKSLKKQTLLREALFCTALALSPISSLHAEEKDLKETANNPPTPVSVQDYRLRTSLGAWLPRGYEPHTAAIGNQQLTIEPWSITVVTSEPTIPAATLKQMSFSNPATFEKENGLNLIKGEFHGGVQNSEEGFRYKLKWSKNSLKLTAKYQF